MAEKTLPCKECGYSNEPQRIYCHNCGTKLDRSAVSEATEKKESHSRIQKRVKKVVSPNRGFFAGWKSNLFNAVLWAAVAAGLIRIVLPPAKIPEMIKEEEKGKYVNFIDVLLQAARTPISQNVSFKEDDANRFLANTVRGKSVGYLGDQVKFVRCFVQFENGVVKVSTHQTIFGYPIYASSWYSLQIKEDDLDAKCVGGAIGRLQIHPQIMDLADYLMNPLWNSLKTERRGLGRMKSIEVRDGEMIVTTPAVPQHGPASVTPSPSPSGTPSSLSPSHL